MDNEIFTHPNETFAQPDVEPAPTTQPHGVDDVEIQEWLESLDAVLESSGAEVATEILERLRAHATVNGIDLPFHRQHSICQHHPPPPRAALSR
jgi:hypothetical protein